MPFPWLRESQIQFQQALLLAAAPFCGRYRPTHCYFLNTFLMRMSVPSIKYNQQEWQRRKQPGMRQLGRPNLRQRVQDLGHFRPIILFCYYQLANQMLSSMTIAAP